eukprot:scaffold15885_cov127-Isochrysis_galbana.AAC.9
MTCSTAAMEMRPCLISISWKRRYLSGIVVIRPSGSYTPSGLVVPTSPGVMAVMRTLDRAGRLTIGAESAKAEAATVESMSARAGTRGRVSVGRRCAASRAGAALPGRARSRCR